MSIDNKEPTMGKRFEIETKRLKIKPMGMEYLESVHEYAGDAENTKYMMFLPNDSIDVTREYLTRCERDWDDMNSQVYECAVVNNSRLIGGVSLYAEGDTAEIGWILNKKYWGKGYTTEAASALMGYAVNALGIKHFTAHCDAENKASYRVMEKLGMRFVSKTGGRRNKLTPIGEERFELLYRLDTDKENLPNAL